MLEETASFNSKPLFKGTNPIHEGGTLVTSSPLQRSHVLIVLQQELRFIMSFGGETVIQIIAMWNLTKVKLTEAE
jgi:hypothetical protein